MFLGKRLRTDFYSSFSLVIGENSNYHCNIFNGLLFEFLSCYRRKFQLSLQTEVVKFEHLLNLNPLYRF